MEVILKDSASWAREQIKEWDSVFSLLLHTFLLNYTTVSAKNQKVTKASGQHSSPCHWWENWFSFIPLWWNGVPVWVDEDTAATDHPPLLMYHSGTAHRPCLSAADRWSEKRRQKDKKTKPEILLCIFTPTTSDDSFKFIIERVGHV